MPINISNINNNTSQTSRTNEQSAAKGAAKTLQPSDSAIQQSAKATLEQDSVNLTDSAMRIKSLEAQIARLPIVDTQKVEQVKNSLSNGTFEFNSERIAEKLISFERNLV